MTTSGQSIRQSPVIAQAIDAIVAEIDAKTASITDVRPPTEALRADYDALVKAAGDTRGWPLLYPMLGSGAGRGALVELADGSVKWDLVAGIGVHFLGHSHPEMLRAQLRSSLEDTTKHGNLQSGTLPYAFAKRFVELAGRSSRLKYAYLTTSGAMANECAMRVCMQKRNADRVLAFEHCFMGRSLTMTSIGDNAAARDGLPVNTAVDYIPFWNAALAERMGGQTKFIDWTLQQLATAVGRYPGRHACFVMELIQGEGGFNVPPKAFLEELMKACKGYGIPVWDDEIQTFGRTEQMFAFEHFGLGEYVDVFCVGKMTHACAALWTEEMKPRPGLLSGTFIGSTVDFEVGMTVLDVLEKGNCYGPEGIFAQHHAAFRAQAEALVAKHPEWFPKVELAPELIGGVGGMMRLTPFGGAKDKIAAAGKALFDEGAIMFWCGHGPYHLRLLPPMPAMRVDEWPRIFEVIERGLARVA
ncbi:MAG: aminotransferase class III-fold pyridoxal phosphate-dependent enzyme [Myxococcales bacterium]|nr:aminotransferase class III-fold pyridoxal phosphate-dependent enzyme [Myxococcales bacterium]